MAKNAPQESCNTKGDANIQANAHDEANSNEAPLRLSFIFLSGQVKLKFESGFELIHSRVAEMR